MLRACFPSSLHSHRRMVPTARHTRSYTVPDPPSSQAASSGAHEGSISRSTHHFPASQAWSEVVLFIDQRVWLTGKPPPHVGSSMPPQPAHIVPSDSQTLAKTRPARGSWQDAQLPALTNFLNPRQVSKGRETTTVDEAGCISHHQRQREHRVHHVGVL